MNFSDINGKNITVLGAERSGIAAAKLILKLGGIPFVSDTSADDKMSSRIAELTALDIEFELGNHSERVYNAEYLVVSPGIPSDAFVLVRAAELGVPVISEVEFAFNFCKGKVIAITGTNGKTTTTSLVQHILKTAGLNSFAVGNIGNAFSESVLDDSFDKYFVLEVSSFQLDHIVNFKPDSAVILNITPDHLNRYNNDMKIYAASKYGIFKNMDENGTLVLNADDNLLVDDYIHTTTNLQKFSLKEKVLNGAFIKDKNIVFAAKEKELFSFLVEQLLISGMHNVANAMAAVLSVLPFVNDYALISRALRSFPGVEHRLELVKTINGVKYVNDSKATNVDSVFVALQSFDTPILLILGGKDKGNDYSVIRDLVQNKVIKIFAIGESAEKVFKYFHKIVKTEIKRDLAEVLESANSEARKGEVVLFSPACASFDMFDNYEHRGKVFKQEIERIAK